MEEKRYIEGRLKLNDNIVSVIASNDTKDRDGDVINPNGWELERFKQNPVILWSHNPSLLPIGKAKDVFVQDNQLRVDVEFADHEFAKEVEKLVGEGFINTTSVGFMPLEVDEKTKTMSKQELLELSFVNVPSNPDAQVLRSKAFEAKVKEFEKKKIEDEPVVKEGRVISEKNRNIMRIAKDSMQQSIGAIDDVLEASEPKPKDMPEEKGIIEKPKAHGKTVNKTLRLAKLMDKVAEAIIHEQKKGGEK